MRMVYAYRKDQGCLFFSDTSDGSSSTQNRSPRLVVDEAFNAKCRQPGIVKRHSKTTHWLIAVSSQKN